MFKKLVLFVSFVSVTSLVLTGCETGRNYQGDIDSLNSRVSSMQGQLAEKDQQIVDLQNQLSRQNAELKDRQDELQRAASEKDALNRELQSAKTSHKKAAGAVASESDLK